MGQTTSFDKVTSRLLRKIEKDTERDYFLDSKEPSKLFLFPAILGLLPAVILYFFPGALQPGRISFNAWNSGIACVTISSLLRGIFEIAGNSSIYQILLFYLGMIFLMISIPIYLSRR